MYQARLDPVLNTANVLVINSRRCPVATGQLVPVSDAEKPGGHGGKDRDQSRSNTESNRRTDHVGTGGVDLSGDSAAHAAAA